jgi:hypothetical protein
MLVVLSLVMLSALFAVFLLSWKRGSRGARDERR